MHKLVNSSWFMVSSHRKTTNYQLPTTNKRQRRLGLTLIELLVVIAILGILASFTSFALIGHQKQARDAQRKSDLQQVKKAMEAAKNDCRGAAYYPAVGAALSASGQFNQLSSSIGYLNNTNLKYLNSIITSQDSNNKYLFYQDTTPTTNVCTKTDLTLTQSGIINYAFLVILEDHNDPGLKTSFAKCKDLSLKWTSTDAVSPNGRGAPADTNSDGIDDQFYYYVCND